jgi:hypothetical protein
MPPQDDGKHVYTLFMVISSPDKRKERDALRESLQELVNTPNEIRRKENDVRKNSLLFFTGLSPHPHLQVSSSHPNPDIHHLHILL